MAFRQKKKKATKGDNKRRKKKKRVPTIVKIRKYRNLINRKIPIGHSNGECERVFLGKNDHSTIQQITLYDEGTLSFIKVKKEIIHIYQ